ncbi:MAG: hypothetical protein ACOX1L_02930 [Erysipelotrichaceae bacterium]|jgi:hypothetical protein
MNESRWSILADAIRNNKTSYRYNNRIYQINEVDIFLNRWGQFIVIALVMLLFAFIEKKINLTAAAWYYRIGLALAISFAGVAVFYFLFGVYIDSRHKR